MVVCKVKPRPLIEVAQELESCPQVFQDDILEHLNMITTEDTLTRLNDEEGDVLDLDDDEVWSSEQEVWYNSKKDAAPQTEDSDDYETDWWWIN